MSAAHIGSQPPTGRGTVWSDWTPLITATLLFAAIVVIGAGGLRGTDQYWYVADAEAVAGGHGLSTNHVFPVSVLEGLSLPRPFVHNVPPVYVVAVLARLIDPYSAWIFAGFLFTILTALLIARTVGTQSNRRSGAWAGAAYLALPLTVWQTTQPLIETWLAFLVVIAAVLLVAGAKNTWLWVLSTIVVGLLFWSRFSFLPLLLAMPLGFGVMSRKQMSDRWPVFVAIIIVVCLFVVVAEVLFPSHQPFTFAEYVNGTSTWRETDMLFVRPADSLEWTTVFWKAGHALRQQFVPDEPASAVFYWPFTLMAGAFLFVHLRRETAASSPWSWIVGAMLIVHLATIVLYRNQFRYILPVTPPLMIFVAVWLSGRPRRPLHRWLGILAIVTSALAGTALALWSRESGRVAREWRQQLASAYANELTDDRAILVEYPGAGGFIHGYVLRPGTVAYFDSTLTDNELALIRDRTNAGWVLMRESVVWYPDSVQHVATLPGPDSLRVGLYKIE